MGSVEGPICMGRLLGRSPGPLTVCLRAAACLAAPGFDPGGPTAPVAPDFLRFSAASIVK